MADPERSSPFPQLPELYPRTEFIPAVVVAEEGVSSPQSVAAVQPPALTGEADQATPPAPDRREKRPYETFTGRVAALPAFRMSPKSHQLVASFPLAVHEAKDGEVVTSYRRVVAFGTRAEKVRESLTLGEEVEIAAYKHEGTTKAGKPKVEYYAAAIKRPKPPQP